MVLQRPHLPDVEGAHRPARVPRTRSSREDLRRTQATKQADDGRKTADALANIVRFAFATGLANGQPAPLSVD
jgi:hypothetical protein